MRSRSGRARVKWPSLWRICSSFPGYGQVLHRESVDLNRLVEQVIAEARYEIEDEDRAVDFRVGDLGIAEGDPTLVRQVFAN